MANNSVVYYDDTDGKFKYDLSGTPTEQPSGGGAITAYKTADETKTSDVTLTIDSDLKVPLEAASLYSFKLQVFWNAHANADLQYRFDSLSDSTVRRTTDLSNDNASMFNKDATTNALGNSSDDVITVMGTVETVLAGDFGLVWSPRFSVVDSCTIYKDSWLEVTKLS